VQQADDYADDAPAASPIDGAAVTLDALEWPLVRQERSTLMAALQARAPEATAAAGHITNILLADTNKDLVASNEGLPL
jgi:hypothetical protein